MHDRTGSDLSAMAMNGKRSVKSFPARVISRTPAASLRAKNAEAIMLDFVQPARAGRRRLGRRGQAWLDDAQPWAGTLTQRHTVLSKNCRPQSRVGNSSCGLLGGRPEKNT